MTTYNLSNKIILLIFTFFYLLFSFYVINQWAFALNNPDFYSILFPGGEDHIEKIWSIYKKFHLKTINGAKLYFNNYYFFSLLVLKFLSFFPGFDYSYAGISAVIINLISIYTVCILGFLICFNLSKSKFFSLGIILLVWNSSLIGLSVHIYPDILQLAFIFSAVYFITIESKYKWYLSFIFCGLAFGVKAQGLLVFIYLISFYFIFEFTKLNYKINYSTLIVCGKTFLYSSLFLSIFFMLNHLNPLELVKNLFSSKQIYKDFNNYEKTFRYFVFILGDKINLIVFCITILLGLRSIFFYKENKILFLVSLFFLMLFYFHLSTFMKLVQSPRYLAHLIPLLLILLSISFCNFSYYLKSKQLSIISLVIAILVFVHGLNLLNKNFFKSINKLDYKAKLQNDVRYDGYQFLKSISDKYQNSLVCAGSYAPIPGGATGFKKILKSHQYVVFEKKIKNQQCDILVLDNSSPGRYIWFKKNPDNLIIKKYENSSAFVRLFGKEGFEKTQKLIEFIIKDPNSGYQVIFFNSKIIVLLKNNINQ